MNDSPLGLFGKYLTLWVAISIVIGVLVEVPVMLTLVAIANKTKHKFQN